MDDSQDKVRRNVVVCASLIVLVQFLNVDVRSGASIGIFTVSHVSETKFWIASLVVLLYLFQRYWFDTVTAKQKAATIEDFTMWQSQGISSLLTQELNASMRSGGPLKNITRYGNSRFSAGAAPNNVAKRLENETTVVLYSPMGKLALAGTCNGHLASTATNEPIDHRTLEVEYRLTLFSQVRVMALPVMRSVLFSKGNVDFLIPLYLCAVAAVICVWRLILDNLPM